MIRLRGHIKEQQQLQMKEPAIKRRKLILGQQGFGVTKQTEDRNAKQEAEEREPEAGPSGVQLRIEDNGRLRNSMPNDAELQLDKREKAKQDNQANDVLVTDNYQQIEISRRHNQCLGADNISYRLQVHEKLMDQKISDILGEMYSMFNKLVTDLRNDLHNGDLVRVYLNHPILHTPITLSARPVEELTVEDIMTEVEKVLQSEDELKLDEQFEIHVGILRIPRGGRGKYFADRQQNIYRN